MSPQCNRSPALRSSHCYSHSICCPDTRTRAGDARRQGNNAKVHAIRTMRQHMPAVQAKITQMIIISGHAAEMIGEVCVIAYSLTAATVEADRQRLTVIAATMRQAAECVEGLLALLRSR